MIKEWRIINSLVPLKDGELYYLATPKKPMIILEFPVGICQDVLMSVGKHAM